MPTPENVIFFETPAQLRAWFEANHDTATELWLGYHRKRTGRPSVTWQEVVDQELCFGWIDSVRYSLGDDRSAQRITPRRKGSIWSAININRFQELDSLDQVCESVPKAPLPRFGGEGSFWFLPRRDVLRQCHHVVFLEHLADLVVRCRQVPLPLRIAAVRRGEALAYG